MEMDFLPPTHFTVGKLGIPNSKHVYAGLIEQLLCLHLEHMHGRKTYTGQVRVYFTPEMGHTLLCTHILSISVYGTSYYLQMNSSVLCF